MLEILSGIHAYGRLSSMSGVSSFSLLLTSFAVWNVLHLPLLVIGGTGRSSTVGFGIRLLLQSVGHLRWSFFLAHPQPKSDRLFWSLCWFSSLFRLIALVLLNLLSFSLGFVSIALALVL